MAPPPDADSTGTGSTMVYRPAGKRPWLLWVAAAVALFVASAAAAFYLSGEDPPEVALNAEPTTSPGTTDESAADTDEPVGDVEETSEEPEPADGAEAQAVETLPAETDGDDEEVADGDADEETPGEDEEAADTEEMTDEEREALGENGGGDRPQTPRERLDAHINAGNFFRNRRRYNIAERRYMMALRMSPRNGRALTGISLLKIAKREPNEAVRYARRLVRVRPGSAGARVILGDALALDGDRTGARREYRKALEINPRHRGARRRLRR